MSTWSVASVGLPLPACACLWAALPSEKRQCRLHGSTQLREARQVSRYRFRRRLSASNVQALLGRLFHVVLAIAPATVVAQTVPAVAYEKYTLPNGLEVILSEDHS